ncbi:MAG: glycosyl hydrolase [Proteobacteria bacterium]|nr:glycosyl hydrolase [Pseudomonadota bacterium]
MQSTSNLKAFSIISICFAIATLGGCQTTNTNPPISIDVIGGNSANSYITTDDKSSLLKMQAAIKPANTNSGDVIIKLDNSQKFQTYIGVGAAITDASAFLINEKLDDKQRNDLMRELFSNDGLNLSFTRLTIGASDFSQTHYSLNDVPKGQTDVGLKNFNLDAMPKSVLPIIKAAKQINPQLKIMATPWSAPGWMKTTDSLIGGSLKPEFYQANADYLVKYSQEMRKNGINIDFLSIQNEPHYTGADYPGMLVKHDERAKFVKENLGPALAKMDNAPKILEWDHNWNEPDEPRKVLEDKDAAKYIDGIGWHCYGGSPDTQGKLHDQFPDKDTYFTECSGGEWAKNWSTDMQWQSKNLIIETTRNWAKGVLLWNLALDEKFGPHLGGCGDCRGVVTINSQTGEITRNMEYYVLGHISKFVQIGAKRIASNSGQNDVYNVAFENPDGSIAVIMVNMSKNTQKISLELSQKYYNFEIPKAALQTIIIPK